MVVKTLRHKMTELSSTFIQLREDIIKLQNRIDDINNQNTKLIEVKTIKDTKIFIGSSSNIDVLDFSLCVNLPEDISKTIVLVSPDKD